MCVCVCVCVRACVQEAQTTRIANTHESGMEAINNLVGGVPLTTFPFISEAVIWDLFPDVIVSCQDAF